MRDPESGRILTRSSIPEPTAPPAPVTMPYQQRSLGSERGLATPSPDGRGEITLSLSIKIMPLES